MPVLWMLPALRKPRAHRGLVAAVPKGRNTHEELLKKLIKMERSKKTERGWQGRETSGLFLSISPLGCLQDTLAAVPLPRIPPVAAFGPACAAKRLHEPRSRRGGGNGEIWLEILVDLGD